MALVLARLRLAIQIGGVRRGGVGGVVWFLSTWVLGLAIGLTGAYAVAWLDNTMTAVGDFLVLLMFLVVFVGWVLSPITVPIPGGDVVDPAVLEQYPLNRSQQLFGLLLGGLLGPSAVGTFLFASGGVAAFTPQLDLASRIAAVGGAVLFTVMCAGASYAVRALLSEALSSRRGRDVAVIVSSALLVGLFVFDHAGVSLLAGGMDDAGSIVSVLSWTPPGAAASLVFLVDDGDWLGGALRTLVVLVTIAAALLLWAFALRRHVKGHSARQTSKKATTTSRELVLVPAFLNRIGAGPTLAAASQQLRYYFFRAPRAVQFVVMGPVLAILFAGTQLHNLGLPLSAAIAALTIGFTGLLDLFGYDGRGVELTVQSGAPLGSILRGKLLAVSLYIVPLVAALTFGFSIFVGDVRDVPLALLAAYAATAFAYALGAVMSTWNPYDQENPQGNRSALGVRVMGSMVLMFGVTFGLAWVWSWATPVVPMWVSAVVTFVAAMAAAVIAVRVAGRAIDRNSARMLAAFTPR